MERWRKPVIPKAVETDADEFYWDGHDWRKQVDVTLDPEDYERLKQGYVCVNCLEPNETPFPEACSLCGFAMRLKQKAVLEFEFRGEKKLGPSTSLSDEKERLSEWGEKQIWTPGGSIIVPGT